MQPDLPTELLDYIFSFLQDDPTSLNACTGVSTLYAQIAEKHIYSTIRLHNSDVSSCHTHLSSAQLLKLLIDSPHLTSHVRAVRIAIGSVGILRWFMTRSMNDEDIAAILRLLPNVNEISLIGKRHSKTSWQRFQHKFQWSFAQALRSSTLSHVVISGIDDFPLILLEGCVHLKRLSLVGTFIFNTDHSPARPSVPEVNNQRTELDMLYFRCNTKDSLSNIDAWLRSDRSPMLRKLRRLRAAMQRREEYSDLGSILVSCSASLEQLELLLGLEIGTLYDMNDNIVPNTVQPSPFDLSTLPQLKSLLISTKLTASINFWIASNGEDAYEDYAYITPFPWIGQLLSSFSSSNRLERVVLEISFNVDTHTIGRLCWETLVGVFQSGIFPSLREVELKASYTDNGPLDLSTLVKMLESDPHLSQLINAKLLRITGYKPHQDSTIRL